MKGVSRWSLLVLRKNFKGNKDCLHLLGNGISPEGYPCFFVNLQSPFNRLGQFHPKLGVGPETAPASLHTKSVSSSSARDGPTT